MSRMLIDDESWGRLRLLLPKPKGRHGKDDRLFLEAICWDNKDWSTLAGSTTRLW